MNDKKAPSPPCKHCVHRIDSRYKEAEDDTGLDLCESPAVLLEYLYNPALEEFRDTLDTIFCDVERAYGPGYSACTEAGKYFEPAE
jgi:hypothetical protein